MHMSMCMQRCVSVEEWGKRYEDRKILLLRELIKWYFQLVAAVGWYGPEEKDCFSPETLQGPI